MLDLLKQHFGYESFRPLQKDIIDTVLAGNDAFVLMPTGGGKSLCYQLPALALPGMTLVVSPLIALMKDQVDALQANGISAAYLNSSLTPKERASVMQRAEEGKIKLLYLAPERIGSYGFTEFLERIDVSLLAIDEAHCISEWGHDFRPDYRNLFSLRNRVASAPVIALTATATPQVRADILKQLRIDPAATFISSFNRENLHYSIRPKYDAISQLRDLLSEEKGSAIVYCFSRKQTEEVAEKLNRSGVKALAYHAGLEKDVRMQTQDKFIRDEVSVIAATIAFGMGIDKPDVRLVVHMDLPKTIEGYYQETGRAGRDGLPSTCVLLYSYADKRKQDYFIDMINDEEEQQLAKQKLADVIDYCQRRVCRRAYLLMYFGEEYDKPLCDACDYCVGDEEALEDATELAQKILSAVLRTGERFGAAHVCDVLRGSKKKRILELGHDKLSVHGICKGMPAGALRSQIEALRVRGYLEQSEGDYPTLEVSRTGRIALRDGEVIELPPTQKIKPTLKKRPSTTDLAYDEALFERLRALRKELADENDVPPFIIFGDKTLYEMAYHLPKDKKELSGLFGVGKKKLEAFGDIFLERIAAYTEGRAEVVEV